MKDNQRRNYFLCFDVKIIEIGEKDRISYNRNIWNFGIDLCWFVFYIFLSS